MRVITLMARPALALAVLALSAAASSADPVADFYQGKTMRVIIGYGAGGGSTSVVYPLALNAYAGTKMKLVRGYEGTAEIQLAVERGEAEINPAVSLPGILVAHPEWIKKGDILVLYQNALKRDPVIPNIPTMLELASTDEGKTILRVIAGTTEIGRSILTTPGVPAERLAALRKAFHDMVADPDFLATCAKRNLQIAYASGEEMEAINAETMRLPKPTVDALRVLLKD